MKVVLQDIVREVAKTTKLARPDAKVVVRRLISTLEKGLLEGETIEIRDFGVFKIKWVKGKKARDMARNLTIFLPAYPKVSFKAGKNLRNLFRNLPEEQGPALEKNGQLEMPILLEGASR